MSLFKYFKRTATTSASSIGMNLKDSESESSECVNCNDSGRARIDFSWSIIFRVQYYLVPLQPTLVKIRWNVSRPKSSKLNGKRPESGLFIFLAMAMVLLSTTTADIGKDQVKRKQAKEFKAEWKKTREWLVYLPGNGMFCSLCQKYDLILYLWMTFDPVFYSEVGLLVARGCYRNHRNPLLGDSTCHWSIEGHGHFVHVYDFFTC